MSIFDISDFGCEVTSVTYDLQRQTGHVRMPAGNCTDMDLTVKYFVDQIPGIQHIITWCDGEVDTQYITHENKWIAI